MIAIRRSKERGHADHGWLDSYHTFSFAGYRDPRFMGFRTLRVINEDRVAPGMGFGKHGHQDMEILSYVLDGALEHRDSMGNRRVLAAGDVQKMSAGTGVEHSEMNPSAEEEVHFLQIWILPRTLGITPDFIEKTFPEEAKKNRLCPIAAPVGSGLDGALEIHQDVTLYASILEPGRELSLPLAAGRHAWVQVARGGVEVNGRSLDAGDGAALSAEAAVTLSVPADAASPAELLLFELA